MKKNKTISWILALLPIVGIYSIMGVNISNMILILLVLYGIYRTVQHQGILKIGKIDKILVVFWIYTLVVSLINIFFSKNFELTDILTKYIHLLCFIFIIALLRNNLLNEDWDSSPFILVALVSSVFLIIQFIFYNFNGIEIYGVLEMYRTNITNDITRPSSFFVEPAHFCRYCVLPLFLILFEENLKNRMFKAVLISVAIILSQSSIGYISLALIWVLWLINTLHAKKISYNKVLKSLLLIVPALLICIKMSSKFKLFNFVLEHISGLNMKEITSGNVRIFRGFWIWKEEPFLNKLFGVGFANVKTFLINNRIRTIFDGMIECGNEYMSAISYILVINGIIGLAIFLYALWYLFLKGGNNKKILILLFIVLMLSNEEFQSVDFINIWLYLLLEISYKRVENRKVAEVEKENRNDIKGINKKNILWS